MTRHAPQLALLCSFALLFPTNALAGEGGSNAQSAKQVSKTLSGALKTQLKERKSEINAATSTLKAELKALTKTFKSGDATADDASDLFDALHDFQVALAGIIEDAGSLYSPIFEGLGDLDPSDDSFSGVYPDDFMPGAGGRHDDFLADLNNAIAKPYKSLQKQLLKLRALADKKSGLLINVRLSPVRGVFEQAVNEGASTGGGRRPLTIDLTMSAHDSENVRMVWVAGSATNFGGDLPVLLFGLNSSTQDAEFVGQYRYQRAFTGFNPGNYLLEVRAEGDDYAVRQSIGLR
ncbi:MAG: hypothetical protein DHS20C15_13260 [Planctomycetota bacterium]|nr:MAG: hypothetical protein DHS20C15_13260 [Planctomycetota bacterium]